MRQAIIQRFDKLDYSANEAMNTICTNLSFVGRDVKRIIITSSTASEGKTFITMQIAANMARRGKRVVVVDTDMRRSFAMRDFSIKIEGQAYGLAHCIAGYCSIDDILYQTNIENIYLVPIGREVANPISLIDSPYFADLMEKLGAQFDLVLVDSPPVGLVVDAAEIAKNCDGALFVVEYGKRRRGELIDAVQQMRQSSCPVLGCVINKMTFKKFGEKGYYKNHYYTYGAYSHEPYTTGSGK